jgi:hypothetical protein
LHSNSHPTLKFYNIKESVFPVLETEAASETAPDEIDDRWLDEPREEFAAEAELACSDIVNLRSSVLRDVLADDRPQNKVQAAASDCIASPEIEDSRDLNFTEIQW